MSYRFNKSYPIAPVARGEGQYLTFYVQAEAASVGQTRNTKKLPYQAAETVYCALSLLQLTMFKYVIIDCINNQSIQPLAFNYNSSHYIKNYI